MGFKGFAAVVSSMMLGALLMMSTGHAGAVAGFGDVPSGIYYAAPVQWMVDNGITTGTSPGCFSPDGTVTRGQAAAFLWRMEGEPAAPDHSFNDVTATWQQGAVSWMAHEAITTGTTASTYSPNDPLTRGQLAALLWRHADEPDEGTNHGFGDVERDWQQGPVAWMVANAITTGVGPGRFAPDDPVTRGQLAAFLYRYNGSPTVTVDESSVACGEGEPFVPPSSSSTAPNTPSSSAPPSASSSTIPPAAVFTDTFDGGPVDLLSNNTTDWLIRNPGDAQTIDIDASSNGQLVIVPQTQHQNGWYENHEGPFVYRNVTGDFAAAIRVKVTDPSDAGGTTPPSWGYKSGGFVVRDGSQPADWIMYNVGNQDNDAGHPYKREVKTTVDGNSTLILDPVAELEYRLLVCRVGDELRYWHGPGSTTAWFADPVQHTRADFGDTLQVGLVANSFFNNAGGGAYVEVDTFHLGQPTSLDNCTTSVPQP